MHATISTLLQTTTRLGRRVARISPQTRPAPRARRQRTRGTPALTASRFPSAARPRRGASAPFLAAGAGMDDEIFCCTRTHHATTRAGAESPMWSRLDSDGASSFAGGGGISMAHDVFLFGRRATRSEAMRNAACSQRQVACAPAGDPLQLAPVTGQRLCAVCLTTCDAVWYKVSSGRQWESQSGGEAPSRTRHPYPGRRPESGVQAD